MGITVAKNRSKTPVISLSFMITTSYFIGIITAAADKFMILRDFYQIFVTLCNPSFEKAGKTPNYNKNDNNSMEMG